MWQERGVEGCVRDMQGEKRSVTGKVSERLGERQASNA
jgi:hypothetical protein